MLFENYSLSSSNLSSKKSIRDILKNIQKTSASFNEVINDNDNSMKIDHIYTTSMDIDLDMDTSILNIKYKMYNDGYMY